MRSLIKVFAVLAVVFIAEVCVLNYLINLDVKEIREAKEPVTSSQIRDAELSGAIEKTYDPQSVGLNK